jgi:hypothetical protein
MKTVLIIAIFSICTLFTGCKKADSEDKKVTKELSQKELFASYCKKADERMATCAPQIAKQHVVTEDSLKRCVTRLERDQKANSIGFLKKVKCLKIQDCKKFRKCAFATSTKRRVAPPK